MSKQKQKQLNQSSKNLSSAKKTNYLSSQGAQKKTIILHATIDRCPINHTLLGRLFCEDCPHRGRIYVTNRFGTAYKLTVYCNPFKVV